MTRSGGSIRGEPGGSIRGEPGGSIRGERERPRRAAPPRDPYGVGPVPDWTAPALAFVGLVIVAWVTFSLLGGQVRLPGMIGPGDDPGGGARTPAPSGVVVVDPRADVPGSIIYVKSGNVWVQSGTSVRQLTTTGRASQPAWSADGDWVYYIETREERGRFPAQGRERTYEMDVPSLMRIRSDGSALPETLADGLITPGRYTWFHWLRQPTPAPDGRTVAILSDGPDPTRSNLVVQLYDIESAEYTRPDIPENPPLGHQDPAWRPDGGLLLVVQNDREGARGAARILRWNPDTGRTSALTNPGYLAPSWSRDMRWIAATRSSNLRTDIVVLDARTGAEVFQVTDDGRSWSPVWSPMGDAIAFFHEEGGIVDLRLARLEGEAPTWQVTERINLTAASGLEAVSRPGWFIPADQLPALPTPPATGLPTGAPEASPAP